MMNDYYQNSADAYDFGGGGVAGEPLLEGAEDPQLLQQQQVGDVDFRGRPFLSQEVDFDDPKIASLPKILLMGPRRGGKTSIQVRPVFLKCVGVAVCVSTVSFKNYSWSGEKRGRMLCSM